MQTNNWNLWHVELTFLIQDSYFQVRLTSLVDKEAEDLTSNPKLLAHDTSLFSRVPDQNATANQINNEMHNINICTHQRKKNFNPGTSKQEQDVIFSFKIKVVVHP